MGKGMILLVHRSHETFSDVRKKREERQNFGGWKCANTLLTWCRMSPKIQNNSNYYLN